MADTHERIEDAGRRDELKEEPLLCGCLAPEEFECGDVVCRPFAFVGGCAKLLCSIALLPCALLAYCRHRCCLDLPAWELDGPCPACPAACPGCEVKPCSVRAPARRAPTPPPSSLTFPPVASASRPHPVARRGRSCAVCSRAARTASSPPGAPRREGRCCALVNTAFLPGRSSASCSKCTPPDPRVRRLERLRRLPVAAARPRRPLRARRLRDGAGRLHLRRLRPTFAAAPLRTRGRVVARVPPDTRRRVRPAARLLLALRLRASVVCRPLDVVRRARAVRVPRRLPGARRLVRDADCGRRGGGPLLRRLLLLLGPPG